MWTTTGNSRVAEEVLAATRNAGAVLEALGARVVEESYPFVNPDPSGEPCTIELGGAVRPQRPATEPNCRRLCSPASMPACRIAASTCSVP